MNRKWLLIFSLACLILSVGIMALPNAYLVTWCYPDLDGNWESMFSYFDMGLFGFQGSDIFENIILLVIFAAALICDTLFLHHLVFSERLKKPSLILLAIGILTSCFIASLDPSTNYGHPNFIPFALVLTTMVCAVFMLLRLICDKFKNSVFILTSIVMLCAVFCIFMSSWITIPGLMSSLLLVTSFVFQVIHYNLYKKITAPTHI